MDLKLQSLDEPTDVRTFEKGRFEIYEIGGTVLGRATYEPGWRWTEHLGPEAGTALCEVEHVGLVLTGRAAVKMADGREFVMGPGELFAIPPGHDSWVVGDEPYVSLHIVGGRRYASPS